MTKGFIYQQVRKLISDFAIILAILIFCGIDALVGVDTPKLEVPSEFKVGNVTVGVFVKMGLGGKRKREKNCVFLCLTIISLFLFY